MLLPFYQEGIMEVGCDEAGRGCLAGPVVAAAVILPRDFRDPMLNDSKKLSRSKRDRLKKTILDRAIDYGIGMVDNREIDEINILNASFKAMHLALDQIKSIDFDLVLVDGNRFIPYKSKQHICIIKGDSTYMSIAAASILAKTHRDELMKRYAKIYPQYDWHKNVGYPTIVHRKALRNFGISEFHRKSFRLFNDQLGMFTSGEEER